MAYELSAFSLEKPSDFYPSKHQEVLQELEIFIDTLKLDKLLRAQLLYYFSALLIQNESLNLTRIVDAKGIFERHLVDTLSLLKTIDAEAKSKFNLKILDLGTGAGIPGLLLAILRPQHQYLLLDSVGKKLHFIDQVISELALDNVSTCHERAELLAKNKPYYVGFNIVVSRAVAHIVPLAELAFPFLKVGGLFIAMKNDEKECSLGDKVFSILGGGSIQKEYYFINDETEHFLYKVRKEKKTPSRFPRNVGMAVKKPLLNF